MRNLFKLLSLFLLVIAILLAASSATRAAPEQQQGDDFVIPGGRFFTQTAPEGYGFSVIDDGQARFWSEFNRLGGLQNVGYPISRRFVYDGFTTQAFQKLVLQWRPEVNQAWPMNVFDELSRNGHDATLYTVRQTPYPLQNFDPPGATWAQVIRNRQALLNANPAIRARYFSVRDPLNVFGLPVSRVEDMGNHYAIRTQRAVFQQWKERVPWAAPGQVTIANGGDIAKELGWLSPRAMEYEPIPGTVPPPTPTPGDLVPDKLYVGGGTPPRLYLTIVDSVSYRPTRLLVSHDGAQSWNPYPNGLPTCARSVDVVPGASDLLTVTTCDGIYREQGQRWVRISSKSHGVVATNPANSSHLWFAGEYIYDFMRSRDGGNSWQPMADGLAPAIDRSLDIIVDPRDNETLFATATNHYGGGIFYRYRAGATRWEGIPHPSGAGLSPTGAALALDARLGVLYATPIGGKVFRTRDLSVPSAQVQWDEVGQIPNAGFVTSVVVSYSGDQQTLYVVRSRSVTAPSPVELLRSTDGGASWQLLPDPPR